MGTGSGGLSPQKQAIKRPSAFQSQFPWGQVQGDCPQSSMGTGSGGLSPISLGIGSSHIHMRHIVHRELFAENFETIF